ncbi:MAG TPA: dienelactone hydrolase family protein [Gemmatimonadales bacterium]|nr:dienelactone hydrolase family protein [Gemmatimonadales bacterium]
MRGRMVELRSNGRTANGYLAASAGRGPGLVLIQEWWGLVPHIEDLADRFAAEGFVTLAPDLFHGKQTRSPDEAAKLLMALNIGEAARDMHGAGQYLLGQAEVEPKRVGIMGFCMGGQLALFAAQEYPETFSAAVDFYGVHPNVPIDPGRVRVPVLGHFGRKDKSVKETDARALAEKARAGGASFTAYFYDAGHAFFNDTRPEAYDAPSADLAWQRTLAFLREHLV